MPKFTSYFYQNKEETMKYNFVVNTTRPFNQEELEKIRSRVGEMCLAESVYVSYKIEPRETRVNTDDEFEEEI